MSTKAVPTSTKAKAPFKRGQKLTLTDVNVNGGKPVDVTYVRWMGFERAALIVVDVDCGACLVNAGRHVHQVTVHVDSVKVRT